MYHFSLDFENMIKKGAGVSKLPEPFQIIQRNHRELTDIVDISARFYQYSVNNGFENKTYQLLDLIGQSFLDRFTYLEFYNNMVNIIDPKQKRAIIDLLNALNELSIFFGNRIPSIVWESYAYMAIRENPFIKEKVYNIASQIRLPWLVVDAVWHSVGKVWSLKNHIDSVIFKHSGLILSHSCDCNHVTSQAKEGHIINVIIEKSEIEELTKAFYTHFLAELKLLVIDGLPFMLGLSEGIEETLNIQKENQVLEKNNQINLH